MKKVLFIFGALLTLSFTTPSEVEFTDSISSTVVNEIEEDLFGCGPNGVGVVIHVSCASWCVATRAEPIGIASIDAVYTHRTPTDAEINFAEARAEERCRTPRTTIQP